MAIGSCLLDREWWIVPSSRWSKFGFASYRATGLLDNSLPLLKIPASRFRNCLRLFSPRNLCLPTFEHRQIRMQIETARANKHIARSPDASSTSISTPNVNKTHDIGTLIFYNKMIFDHFSIWIISNSS